MQARIQRIVSAALAAVVAGMLMMTLGVGAAWALNVDCTINFATLCPGTNNDDFFEGEDVDDGDGPQPDGQLAGGTGINTVHGGDDDDRIDANDSLPALPGDPAQEEDIFGDAGNDTIEAVDGEVDNIDCGDDSDTVTFDEGIDLVDINCENQFPV